MALADLRTAHAVRGRAVQALLLLCRPTAELPCELPPLSAAKGAVVGTLYSYYTQVMETLAANGDGQAEARRANHFRQRWRLSMESLVRG